MAATVSLASCLAFVLLVPSHVRPQHAPPPAPAAATAAAAAGGSAEGSQEQQKKSGFQLAQFVKDVCSMGGDFYRMLIIICFYGMGHINEVGLAAG